MEGAKLLRQSVGVVLCCGAGVQLLPRLSAALPACQHPCLPLHPCTCTLCCHLAQVLVEAELADGDRCSVLLQNAETVRLVAPNAGPSGDSRSSHSTPDAPQEREPSWRAVSVSELAAGEQLLVLRQAGARHTGVAIEESITER